jgi:hypothetical protein
MRSSAVPSSQLLRSQAALSAASLKVVRWAGADRRRCGGSGRVRGDAGELTCGGAVLPAAKFISYSLG